ncbi:hypothetical protein ACFFVH_39935, partial [Streptomyces echinatus]|uniref:hypothetical protein n=1 Tax=Streptomyces echinatus TaxID=67293 RepID=UPI0035EF68AC
RCHTHLLPQTPQMKWPVRRIAHRRAAGGGHHQRRFGAPGGRTGRVPRLSLVLAALPGLTAMVALVFTWMSVQQTRTEMRIAEQGQIRPVQ